MKYGVWVQERLGKFVGGKRMGRLVEENGLDA